MSETKDKIAAFIRAEAGEGGYLYDWHDYAELFKAHPQFDVAEDYFSGLAELIMEIVNDRN